MPFKKATPDSPLEISATTWNQLCNIAQRYQDENGPGNGGLSGKYPDKLWCKNNTDDTLNEFDVASITDVFPTPEDNVTNFKYYYSGIIEAVTCENKHKFVIVQSKINKKDYGLVLASGVSVAKVKKNSADHNYADPKEDEVNLESAESGNAVILYWGCPLTGQENEEKPVCWCLIRFGNTSDNLVRFKLTEAICKPDSPDPVKGKVIDKDGEEVGDEIDLYSSPALKETIGPAGIGFTGWAVKKSECSSGSETSRYEIIQIQHYARYIKFTADSCSATPTVEDYWDGLDPGTPTVEMIGSCDCQENIEGVGFLDPEASDCEGSGSGPKLVYRGLIDSQLKVATAADCGGTQSTSTKVSTLVFSDGITATGDGCTKAVSWGGMEIRGSNCPTEGGSRQDDSNTGGTGTKKISFEQPFEVSVTSGCPGSTVVGLADDLIKTDDECLTITKEDCRYNIKSNFKVEAGTCATVTKDGCTYTVGLDPECVPDVNVQISGDECITVTPDPVIPNKFALSNEISLKAGNCATVNKEGCEWTIGFDESCSATPNIEAGDCISVTEDNGTTTIGNTMTLSGGDGINVIKQGCNWKVELTNDKDPPGQTTTLRFVCDIVCGSGGIEVKYTTLTLPSAVVYALTSDCGGGLPDPDPCITCAATTACNPGDIVYAIRWEDGTIDCECGSPGETGVGGIHEGWTECEETPLTGCAKCQETTTCLETESLYARINEDDSVDCECGTPGESGVGGSYEGWTECEETPLYTCTSCPNCAEGETKVIKDDGTECDCITGSIPEGWTLCEAPDGDLAFEITAVECENPAYDYYSVSVVSLPAGAAQMKWETSGGSCTSTVTHGPTAAHLGPSGSCVIPYTPPEPQSCGPNGLECGQTYTSTMIVTDSSGHELARVSNTFSCTCPPTEFSSAFSNAFAN